MSDRLRCCVPFCNRTTARSRLKPGHDEWLCGNHWRLVDPKLKALKRRAEKRGRAWLAGRAWARCRCQAIERAAGI